MHERELDKEHSLVTYSLPADGEKCVVNGNVSIAHSPNPHVGDIYHIYGPVTYLHQKGKGGDVTSTPCVLDVAADKVDLQNHEDTNNSSKVCIVGEQKFKIRKLHILVAACLILVATAATLSTIFILRDRASAGGGDNDDGVDEGPLVIIPRGEWFALPRRGTVDAIPIQPTPYVILSDAASTCTTKVTCANVVRFLQSNNFNMKYYDIAYNFIIGSEGSVFEGRGWDIQGAHTLSLNNRSIGITVIGYYENSAPSKRIISSLWKLLKFGVESNKIDANFTIFTHRQIRQSSSPGKAFYNLIKTWPQWKEYDSKKDIPPYNFFYTQSNMTNQVSETS